MFGSGKRQSHCYTVMYLLLAVDNRHIEMLLWFDSWMLGNLEGVEDAHYVDLPPSWAELSF